MGRGWFLSDDALHDGRRLTMASVEKRAGRIGHVVEFDGLRGYLAWWVVLFHLYQTSGINAWKSRPLELTIGQGFGSVPIFFILSGFVIALMDDIRQESYPSFLIRRFFRLGPVYYMMLAIGIIEAWRSQIYGDLLWAHVAAHLTMLHGLIPEQILPGSAYAIDFVAWSVSVEWQFYLLAPLILAISRRSATRTLVLLAGFGGVAYLSSHGRFSFGEKATVFLRGGLFAVGIGSYFIFHYVMNNLESMRKFAAYALPFGLALAWICGGPFVWPGPIWVVLFCAVQAYHAGVETLITRPIRVMLSLPAMVWLGKVSYCTYLCHNRIFEAIDSWNVGASPLVRFMVLVVVGFPLVLAGSAALHHLVEKPGIQLGKRLAQQWERRAAAAAGVLTENPVG